MGTQNLNNYYFNRLDAKINYSSYYDLFLAADEKDFNQQVIYSTNVIDYDNGDSLPVWIDLNSTDSGDQPITNCLYQYPTAATPTYYTDTNYRPFVILSKNSWSKAKAMCDCPYAAGNSTFRICDGFWTNLDNGLNNDNNANTNCITLYDTLPTANIFDIFAYDKRFKMHQVKAFGFPWWVNTFYTDTTILNASDTSGYYQELCGGFYQGFYKLYGYPYEVLPTRPNKGWSFETYLKLNTISDTLAGPITAATDTGGVYGNCYNTSGFNLFGPYVYTRSGATCCSPIIGGWWYPQFQLNYSSINAGGITAGRTDKYGFFFYKGIRAEDKYFHPVVPLTTCSTLTGITNCCNQEDPPVKLTGQNKSPTAQYDVYSNALGFRITDDMKIGYRAIRYTGSCITTGSTCNTGATFQCGYSIEESYSDPICAFITKSGDSCADTWIQVDVVFDRNLYLEDCEIYNNGGINDLVKVRTDKFQRYGTHHNSSSGPFGCHPNPSPQITPCKDEYPRFIEDAYFNFNCHKAPVQKWFDEKEYRMGTLTFYINGRRVHKVEDYEEIIPRQLNTNKQTQVGVAYNMSWGGGALGLRETLYPTSCDYLTANFANQTQNTDQQLIMQNFAGSFIGGISQMMYYIKPLTADEIYHNFLINKYRYSLIDCEECKNCNNGCIDCRLTKLV